MSHDQAVLNRVWSETILIELQRFGVKHVCIAPGSRSTPLTLEAAEQSDFSIHTHFDERGLGFMALGLAKATQEPVAIIVTSGTAVANLLPSVAEAKLTGEKLVLLTADRPVELVGCGANQAINQLGIFSHHVSASLNLPSPNLATSLNWLLTSVDEVMFTQQLQGSAVHINCAFPEPLYSNGAKADYQTYLDSVAGWRKGSGTYTQRFSHLSQANIPPFSDKKGLVVIGSLPLEQARSAQAFAQKMGWPVLADPQSGLSSDWAYYDVWLQLPEFANELESCELIIQFGSRIISKRLNQWIDKQVSKNQQSKDVQYWYVSPCMDRNNQNHLAQMHWVEPPKTWVSRISFEKSIFAGWADRLANDVKRVHQRIEEAFLSDSASAIDEIALAADINERTKNVDVFLGNSLFVRLVDMYGKLDGVEVFTNRGASGIDGLFAAASGVQRARGNPLLMYIGDTAALYDLNSLALFSHNKLPAILVVTNNDGGAIFDMLPVPPERRTTYYQMPHGYQFEHAAKQFGLAYLHVSTLEQFQSSVKEHLCHRQGTLLVEVQTPPNQAAETLKAFNKSLNALL
ncbi:TPA: 2-succinyl-5-enolpyruvyl-6-hydroxy-3-cyclohexene-1-carboxylic-acid synthase [Vibrio alginolyticus]|uniref:2-succinyl-5-enolpyruvyl-6-hydroxy-3- cyclohexene-1-carboxylic-acid synthase n=1 Tax=Vibrio TaxID=662 RepID=UPI001A2E5934|nr:MULTISPECIES: 2-succinyl-5-enolpyruvyl-6-hydroxy-3-cyclohexene-1-carboxylic-acid synthase [Vibrio]EGQ7648926.1 2-succinyl-5-enolpyruvyl-6-hydroxy-3-cyclohexene-1-carboxylic-acid synthase [Vibrio alginolyticus]MBS9989274.1 2-succinyl-5-enolpyruvyl-6-hydroxy-3-cyclohexene-1-carboxylic-acid synthase [Vibrio alginolyticus]MBT0076713.1 2-succinyl-5-enolpyruvyl-6-hydroxy-3-cyclohexene-1-carboxylic-acid synthase [Vibrio alginolyticus]MDW1592189.1 2-succinyl-5-enolpyruvyl-6-hydroxy-3-cyclohexene-1-c